MIPEMYLICLSEPRLGNFDRALPHTIVNPTLSPIWAGAGTSCIQHKCPSLIHCQ